MIPISFDGGSVLLAHGEHHFALVLTDCAHPQGLDGKAAKELLATPVMHCTVKGCSTMAQTTFPLTGDANAQEFHAQQRLAAGAAKDIASARDAVAAEATAARNEAFVGTAVDALAAAAFGDAEAMKVVATAAQAADLVELPGQEVIKAALAQVGTAASLTDFLNALAEQAKLASEPVDVGPVA